MTDHDAGLIPSIEASQKPDAPAIPRQIFFVDDNEVLLSALTRRFSGRVQRLCVFSSGEQLLDALARETPDLIVLDLKLPGLSGLDTLREIRRVLPHVLVMILTAYGTSAELEWARSLGVFDVVIKNVGLEQELEKAVARAFRSLNAQS
ncbi:MAG: response regulator [Nitrospiraceae bacterium]